VELSISSSRDSRSGYGEAENRILWPGAYSFFLRSTAQVSQLVCHFVELTARVTFNFDQRQLLGPLTQFLKYRGKNVEVHNLARIWPNIRLPNFFKIMRRAGQSMNIRIAIAPPKRIFSCRST
jgi:hypothetical protein